MMLLSRYASHRPPCERAGDSSSSLGFAEAWGYGWQVESIVRAGGQAQFVACDVTDSAQHAAAFERYSSPLP